MTISASGYSPCAAAPVATPTVQGGGSVMAPGQPGAPTPPGSAATASLPQPAGTPAVIGGGPGATYAVQQSPVQVGSYVPAPSAAPVPIAAQPSPAPTVAAATAPPEPMTFPGVATPGSQKLPGTPAPTTSSMPIAPGLPGQAASTSVGSAATRANWSQWQRELRQLGLPEKLVATIGASTMSDEEIADLYVEAEAKLTGTGATNGTVGSTSSDAGWNDSWEQRFTKLGLGREDLALIRDEAIKRGSTSDQLGQLYEELARQMATTGSTAPTVGDAAVTVKTVSAKFLAAGAPQEIIDTYAANATSPEGLDAALTTLGDRVDQLVGRGWKTKLEARGEDPALLWSLAMGGSSNPMKPTATGPLPTDGEIQQKLTLGKRVEAGLGKNVLEMGVSMIPGVQLAQRVFGAHNTITDSDMVTEGKLGKVNDGLAIASGVALGAVLLNKGRGLSTLRQGIVAARGGYDELAKASVKGLSANSAATKLSTKAAAGELTFGKTLLNPQLRREVRGLAHVEAAAKQFNANGATKLDTLTRGTVASMFDEIAGGGAVAGGRRLNSIPFKSGPAAKYGAIKGQPGEVLQFNGKLGISDGRSQLAAMAKAGGDTGRAPLPDDVLLSDLQRAGLGDAMAGRAVNELRTPRDSAIARLQDEARARLTDGAPARNLRKLDDKGAPAAWYSDLQGAPRSTTGAARPSTTVTAPDPGTNAGSAASAD